MNILEVKNLSKKYKNVEVIKDISFNVKEGETLVILGASGSGKSTLLRCINNLEKINSGNIIINGEKMIKEYKNSIPIYNDKEVLNKINLDTGMVFQDFNLFPHLSVRENITEALIYVLKKEKKEADKIANELLEKMDLINKADFYPCNLSGGQKQRVSIARCLAINPKIICMDEPTSALDPELIGEVLKVIKKLAREKRTMVIVTHEIKFAEEVADRIIFMDNGKIVEEGTPNEVIRNPKEKRTRDFLKRYIDVDYKNIEKESEENMKNNEELEKTEPKEVIKFFREISDIPRGSANEEKIRDYLVKFAKDRNLEYYTDEYFNVIIRKPATKGFENCESLAFQAHTDMICEKKEGSNHDFTKDPIKVIKDGDFIRADGTTLGADDGLGVADMLAILDSKTIQAPKLECIFTTQEETTMIGAIKIDEKQIKSKRIISLDNGKDDVMVISSANCMEWFGKIDKEYISLENNYKYVYELTYSNFKGGHSGTNISDVKRGNPIKLGIQILSELDDIYINNLEGGSRVNVIPREFKIVFSAKENFEEIINKKINEQKSFYGEEVEISLKKVDKQNKAFSKGTTEKIINFINSYENGAVKFDENDNTLVSGNFAAVREIENYIRFEYSLRSNNMKMRDEYLENLKKNEKENNIEIIWEQELKGFEPDYDSELVLKVSKVYKDLFDKDINKAIVQGVVEGGFFKSKIPGVQYICVGTNTYDIHSPKEKFSIKSLQKTWKFLNEILKEFCK